MVTFNPALPGTRSVGDPDPPADTNTIVAALYALNDGKLDTVGAQTVTVASLELSPGGPRLMSGLGDPEGNVTAPVGSTWHRTDAAQGSEATLWTEDFESGVLYTAGHLDFYQGGTAPFSSTSIYRSGTKAIGFTVNHAIPGDWPGRCEAVPDIGIENNALVEGDDYIFNFSTYCDIPIPAGGNNWQVITQWKNDGVGSPPLDLVVNQSTGNYEIGGGYGWPGTDTPTDPKLEMKSLGAATRNTWVDWKIHIKFSSDPAIGYVEVWRDGTKVLEPWKPPGGTLYPSLHSYLKVGYYRNSGIATTNTVYHDGWTITIPGVSGESAFYVKESGAATANGWVGK